MKTIRILLTLLFLIPIILVNGQNWKIVWEKQLGNKGPDYFTDVIQDQAEGYTVLGSINSDKQTNYDFWLLRFNENGDTLWTKTYGTVLNDVPKKLLQNSEGGYLMLGTSGDLKKCEPLLINTDKDGNELWRKSFSEAGCLVDDFAPKDDGGFVVVGTKGEMPTQKLWMAFLDSNGDIQSEKNPGEKFTGCCKAIKKLPGGGYAVASQVTTDGKPDCDIFVLRTDEKGDVIWESRLRTPGIKVWPECICCSTDSCLMIVGWQGNCMNDINSEHPVFDYDLVLLKADKNGKVLFTKNFDREGSEGGNGLVVRPDGNIVVAGKKETSFLGKIGPWLMLVDNKGDLISENLIKIHFINDQAVKVINSSDGGIVVIGPGYQDESNKWSNGWIMKFSSL